MEVGNILRRTLKVDVNTMSVEGDDMKVERGKFAKRVYGVEYE